MEAPGKDIQYFSYPPSLPQLNWFPFSPALKSQVRVIKLLSAPTSVVLPEIVAGPGMVQLYSSLLLIPLPPTVAVTLLSEWPLLCLPLLLSYSDSIAMVCWLLSLWLVVSFSFDQIKFIFVSLAESTTRYIYVLSCFLKEWTNKWRSILGMEIIFYKDGMPSSRTLYIL